MASRKPSIRRASKKARPSKGAVAFDLEVIEARVKALEDSEARITNHLNQQFTNIGQRFAALEEKAAPPALVLDNLVAKQLEGLVGSMRGIEESMAKVVERMAELLAKAPAEKAPRKPRETKPEPTNGAVAKEGVVIKNADTPDQGSPVAEDPPPAKKEKVDRATCPHPTLEDVPGNDKLVRCTRCGATLDRNPPAGAKAPTFEELRESAVKYAQKHSKQKMLEVLQPFAGVASAADVKLSLIPEAKRRAAMDALVDL